MQGKILLFEDEEMISFLYKRQLEAAGFTVDTFSLGREGIESSKQKPYDLILLDIMLPDMDGIEILKELRNNNVTKTTPVIMMTNLSQESVIKEAYSLGARGYFLKAQYTPDQIVDEVKKTFEDIQKDKQV